MIRILIPLLLLVFGAFLARRYLLQARNPEELKSRKVTVGLVALVIVLGILTLMHRMHWSAVLITVVVVLARGLYNYLRNRRH